ncbi:MAG TPA: hypothetical protein VLG12_02540 [Candidatus Saccharimonadales bacterium]|nr:hypothetical protein [Candidatus Saccharimonadales bacterium]
MIKTDHWQGIVDHVSSVHKNLDDGLGESTARMLIGRRTNPELGINLSTNSRYLALGAGYAHAELELAKLLGLKDENVTLLDKQFSALALGHLSYQGFEGQTVECDMFDFLETPAKEKFDLITGFGLESNYDSPRRFQRLVAGIAANLNIGGVTVLIPETMGIVASQLFRDHGFVSLHKNDGFLSGSTAMVFKPPTARAPG